MTIEELKAFLEEKGIDKLPAQTATGNYIGGLHLGGGTCPACGHCPHCGRGGFHTAPYYPVNPHITWGSTYKVTC